MIHVIGKYGIEVGDKCFAAGEIRNVKRKNKETNVVTEVMCIQSPSYCTSMQSALKAIRKQMQMEALRDFDGDFKSAFEKIQAVDARFEELVANIKF